MVSIYRFRILQGGIMHILHIFGANDGKICRRLFLLLPVLLLQRVTIDGYSVFSKGYFDFRIGLRIDFDEGYFVKAVIVNLDGVRVAF